MNWWVFRRRIHTSWLIAGASLGITVGVILAQHIWLTEVVWPLLGAVLLVLGFWRHKAYALAFVFAAGGLIGMWRGGIDRQRLAPYEKLVGHTAQVTGTVSEDPDVGKKRRAGDAAFSPAH